MQNYHVHYGFKRWICTFVAFVVQSVYACCYAYYI